MIRYFKLAFLPTQLDKKFREYSQDSSMSNKRSKFLKSISDKLKSLFQSSKAIFQRRSKSSSGIMHDSKYRMLAVSAEMCANSSSNSLELEKISSIVSVTRAQSSSSETEEILGKSVEIPSKTSLCEKELKIPGDFSEITDESFHYVTGYKTTHPKSNGISVQHLTKVECRLPLIPMTRPNLSSTLISEKESEPRTAKLRTEKVASSRKASPEPPSVERVSNPRNAKKTRRRRKSFPETVHKLKTGFLVATNHLTERMSGKESFPVNLDKPFTCKKTFKKCNTKETLGTQKNWNSLPKRGDYQTRKPSEMRPKRQRLVKEEESCAENNINERSNFRNTIESTLPNPILDYTFLSMDYFYSIIEQLHDHMDLVRCGIQQLIDNFTQPSIIRLQDQETRMIQFKQSVEMLQHSIERMNYAVMKLPDKISNMRYLLLPCKNTIREFNDHLQKMSVDFEHTQYFNNDSPMNTLLKMIVVIKVLNAVLSRGRRSFVRSADLFFSTTGDDWTDFDVSCYHERFIRPTFEMLYRRTEAMVKLRNFSVILSQRWIDNQDWNTFLPSLQEFMKLIKMVEPFLSVPRDWYAVRILPETRIMHVFDGFMSEFYRAIVTPGFANSNPVAFGSIFVVIQFILDNIINQHVIILRDLNTGLNLPASETIISEPVKPMVNNHPQRSGSRQYAPLYQNVPASYATSESLYPPYQNL